MKTTINGFYRMREVTWNGGAARKFNYKRGARISWLQKLYNGKSPLPATLHYICGSLGILVWVLWITLNLKVFASLKGDADVVLSGFNLILLKTTVTKIC